MTVARTLFTVTWALLLSLLALTPENSVRAADAPSVTRDQLPESLITLKTKQVYRFHFSALLGADATRLAGQLLPVVAKLPADNPLRRTLEDAKDRASFIDDYRSLRASFLDAGIDTVYFLADEYWIASASLPGRVAIAANVAQRDRLQRRLQAAGHDRWAATIAQLQPQEKADGWLVADLGPRSNVAPSPARHALVNHALRTSCPVLPATAHLGSLPALRMSLSHATPLTVVNLEPSTLDQALTDLLVQIAPSASEIWSLKESIRAWTVAASVYPVGHARIVAHLKTPAEATRVASDIQKKINDVADRIADLDDDVGKFLAMFGKSMVVVAAVGSDVHMVVKPPVLFDLAVAQSKSVESLDQDWTALPAPAGYHWEAIGALGVADRRDVFARVRAVRVRGTTTPIAPVDPTTAVARFQLPLPDSELVLHRNLKGQLKVDVAAERSKPAALPALELLDEAGNLAAVLRLDLGPGDPRFDLARTRGVLAKRIAERTETEARAKKALDDVENAHQRAKLEGEFQTNFGAFNEWQIKLRVAHRNRRHEEAARVVCQELDDAAREAQRLHPGATLVKDGTDSAGTAAAWAVDRQKFPFAGQWLFDYGVLTLYQDANGTVAGVFASKVFYNTMDMPIDQSKPTMGSAILVGRAKGAELPFTMYDHEGRYRKGKLTLQADRLSGTWSLAATENEPDVSTTTVSPEPPATGNVANPRGKTDSGSTKGRSKPGNAKKGPGGGASNPFQVMPQGNNPLGLGPAPGSIKGQTGGSPFGLPAGPRPAPRNAEPARNGALDQIQVAPPDSLWRQEVPTASLADYWVHASDKRFNILFKRMPSGLLSGTQGELPAPKGNLRAAVTGNLVLILEHVNMDLVLTPSVVGAAISADGDKLVYLKGRPYSMSTTTISPAGRLELNRQ